MLCGWVCLPCSSHTKQSCQAVNVSKMQINTKQWNKWILMGIMVGSCATDVGLVFEKCQPGHVLTCSLPHNCGSQKKKPITIKTSCWFRRHSYQTVTIIFISFFILHWRWHCSFNISTILQTGWTSGHNHYYQITAQTIPGLVVVFSESGCYWSQTSVWSLFFSASCAYVSEQNFPALPPMLNRLP